MKLKIFNCISTISCIISIVLLYSFIIISDSFYLNGYIILVFLLMLLNPIANLCRLNKKIINNPIFHILIIIMTTYISYVLTNSFIIYINNINGTIDNSVANNMSTLYFSNRLLYIFILIIIIMLITSLFRKNKIKSSKDNSKIMLLIVLVTALIPIVTKSGMSIISAAFDIALLIFSIIVFLKLKSVNTTKDLQGYYLILILCSIISINPIALVLSIYMFLQLDTFGLHI